MIDSIEKKKNHSKFHYPVTSTVMILVYYLLVFFYMHLKYNFTVLYI